MRGRLLMNTKVLRTACVLFGLSVLLAARAAQPAAAGTAAASEPDCPFRFRIALADGSSTCFSNHAIADRRAAGMFVTLGRAVPSLGTYHIAVAAPAASCPAVYGWAWVGADGARGNADLSPDGRASGARRNCASELRAANAPADCKCVMLVADGRSALGHEEFGVLAGLSEAPAVVAVASSAQPQQLAPVPRDLAAPLATTSAAAPSAPSNTEFTLLREQILALQAQMSRQQVAAGAVPTAALPQRPKLRARALIIGNGKYSHLGSLPNPVNDAQAMADKLKKFGIEVDLVLDADRGALVRALGDYQAKAADYDVNILFYAGHGLQVDGINYVVPVEMVASGATSGSVKLNAVSLNDALEYLPARTRVVFLDACRDNPLSRSLRASRSSSSAGLAPVNTTSGTLVAYATKDGSTAEDGRGRNSPYTSALLEHLDADEDIAIVLRRVRQAVLSSTDRRQEPWEYGSLVGDQLVLSRLAR